MFPFFLTEDKIDSSDSFPEGLEELPFSSEPDEITITDTSPCSSADLPPTYSIIFDNLDFYMKAHHQSSLHTNKSIHWINHTAVQDRIQINHLSSCKPSPSILDYNLGHSLPDPETPSHLRESLQFWELESLHAIWRFLKGSQQL